MTEIVGEYRAIPVGSIIVKNRYREEKGDIEELAQSIEEKGLLQAIGVDPGMNLIWGERRLLAHQFLGRKTIKAFVSTTKLSKLDKLELELMENARRKQMTWSEQARLEKAIYDERNSKDPTWSQRKQAEEFGSSATRVNHRIQLAEAMELLPEIGDFETQDEAWKYYKKLEEEAGIQYLKNKVPDAVKEAPKWAADHFLVGDSLRQMETIPSGQCDFAEVDPPYAIDIVNRKERNSKDGPDDEYNEIDVDEFPIFIKKVADETFRILKPDTFAVFWYGLQHHQLVFETLIEAGFKVNPIPAIWYKGPGGQTAQPDIAFGSSYEPFFLARKGVPRMCRQGRGNVFHFAPVVPSKKIHRTEKPVELLKEIIETICFPGSNILVPFLGSGVTLRAAYALQHTGFGWDLSKKNKERFIRKVAEEFDTKEEDDAS